MTGLEQHTSLATSFRRRYHNRFQTGANYTLMFYKHDMGVSDSSGSSLLNPFNPSVDWAPSSDFQRHTVRAYGIVDLPAGLQVSGSFLYGSGNYLQTSTNVDPLGLGVSRIRRDLTIIPRNNYPDDPWQALDPREDLGGIGHLRHILRPHERPNLDELKAGGRQMVDQHHLLISREDHIFAL